MDAIDFYDWYQRMLVISPRALIATVLVPAFAPKLVPRAARAAMALSLVVVAVLGTSGREPIAMPDGALLMLLFLKEAAIGICIGLAFGLVFWLGRTVGELVDHQTGLTFSQNIDQVHGNQTSTTGTLLDQVLITYFFAAGGLLVFADALLLSYELWPVQNWVPDLVQRMAPLTILETSRLFSYALLLAGPLLVATAMVDIGFGILGRAAPQLNLFNLSMPLKGMVALFVLVLALPFMLSRMFDALVSVRNALVTTMGG
jgi:type III secretion protein T